MHNPLYPADFRAQKPPTSHRVRIRRTVTMPRANVSPHVRLVFAEMARLNIGYQDIEDYSGVRRATCKAWRAKNAPSLENLTAALSYLGWDYVPVPSVEALPPELAGEVTRIALKMQRDIPTTWAAMVAVGVEQALVNMSIAERRAAIDGRTSGAGDAANDNAKTVARAS